MRNEQVSDLSLHFLYWLLASASNHS